MPSTIPYDPSLALGAIVDPAAFSTLTDISELDAAIDAAQDTLNSFISMKRSIDMTIHELIDMEVDPRAIKQKSEEIKKEISKAAADYAAIRIENEAKIRPLKAKVHGVHQGLESPVDYVQSKIIRPEISADSLKMESQYFSFEQNEQGAANSMSDAKDFIGGAAAHLGADAATDMATAGVSQIAKQRSAHQIAGTLVITAACTHKQAAILAPLVIDVDRAVKTWNRAFPADRLKTADAASMVSDAAAEESDAKQALNLLSGATYGSSFVGMVHVLRADSTDVGQGAGTAQSLTAVAEGMQEKFEVAAWLEGESGGFGVDAGFANDIKRLLGKQDFTSHVSVMTMGVVASIKSNELQFGVDKFSDFDPNQMASNLANLASTDGVTSVTSTANTARAGKSMASLNSAQVESVMLGLDKIDEQKNKAIDLNSLVTAFDAYLEEVRKGKSGLPINYYVKPLTKAEIAEMWLGKYHPDRSPAAPAARTKKADEN